MCVWTENESRKNWTTKDAIVPDTTMIALLKTRTANGWHADMKIVQNVDINMPSV
jgi:hypothetical protein